MLKKVSFLRFFIQILKKSRKKTEKSPKRALFSSIIKGKILLTVNRIPLIGRYRLYARRTLFWTNYTHLVLKSSFIQTLGLTLCFVRDLTVLVRDGCTYELSQWSIFYFLFSKMPLELWSNTKFQAVWNTAKAWKRRWLCAIYFWSLGIFSSVFLDVKTQI